ncbi:hypothetical protein KP509_14G010600 [Ceratopteris richardii]|uniref:C2 domain-containing protein n=1 Tax=Ceratopteris richardii TaxID=49495 RepID=A0A8T2T9E6_CERRI|nr:hypothetical protein KP509_14G010600 [Ceratopteris richardii]
MEKSNAHVELTIISASDLKRGWFSGDQTVAIAWIDPSTKRSTTLTSGGRSSAEWNEKLTLPLDGNLLAPVSLPLAELAVGSYFHGTARVPLAEFALDIQKGSNRIHTYEIVHPSGKRCGNVNFSITVIKPPLSDLPSPIYSAAPVSSSPRSSAGWANVNELYPTMSHSPAKSSDEMPSSSALSVSTPPNLYARDRDNRLNALYPPLSDASALRTSDAQSKLSASYLPPDACFYPAQTQNYNLTNNVHNFSGTDYPVPGKASYPQMYPPVSCPYQPTSGDILCSHGDNMIPHPSAPYPPSHPSAPYPPSTFVSKSDVSDLETYNAHSRLNASHFTSGACLYPGQTDNCNVNSNPHNRPGTEHFVTGKASYQQMYPPVSALYQSASSAIPPSHVDNMMPHPPVPYPTPTFISHHQPGTPVPYPLEGAYPKSVQHLTDVSYSPAHFSSYHHSSPSYPPLYPGF